MDKINLLCVEDGSVDIDSLEEGLHDGKVVVYRQGAKPPFVLEINKSSDVYYNKWEKLKSFYTDMVKERKPWMNEMALHTIMQVLDRMKEIENE
jgi:hypothetical protein